MFVRGVILVCVWALLMLYIPLVHAQSLDTSATSFEPSGSTEVRPKLTFTTFPQNGLSELYRRILTEAYGRLGFDVILEQLPGKRALIMADSGEVDGEAARLTVIEKTNLNLIRVPTSIFHSALAAFVKDKDIDISTGWDSLKSYRTGVLLGYKYVEAKTAKMQRTLSSTYEQLFNLLDSDRVDVVVLSLFDALKALKDMRLKGIRNLEPPLENLPVHHYLHKKHAELVPKIDMVFREMIKEGALQEIVANMEKELRSP